MNENNPLPLPEGMTQEQIKSLPVNKGEWRKSGEFVCRRCGSPAYLHPYTNWIWGCKKCGYTIAAIAICFNPIAGSLLHPVTSK